jgi:hypothetical protein
MSFFSIKTENRRAKQVPSGGENHWEWGGYKERESEGEYAGNIQYTCMQKEK